MKTRTRTIRPLGKLEEKVMDALWLEGTLSVRQVNKRLGEQTLAYTTVMTTLDRLFKKGFLSRSKDGVAYLYQAVLTRDEYHQHLVEATVSGLMSKSTDSAPVLSAFVDAAAEIDEENLAKLEALIAQRRRHED